MTHARTLAAVAPAADPIHDAITRHRAAYDAFQVAPEGAASLAADDDYDAASDALVATACLTRFGALALLEHLRWWLADEAEGKDGHQPAYGTAEVRVADLALFLGAEPQTVAIPRAMPSGRLALPARPLPTLAGRAPRFLDLAANALAAVVIVGGGIVLTGLATLL